MTPGTGFAKSRGGVEKPKGTEELEHAAMEDLEDRHCRHAPGAIVGCRGVFPQRFSTLRGGTDSGPSHHPSVIFTASGAASAVAAQSRIATAYIGGN